MPVVFKLIRHPKTSTQQIKAIQEEVQAALDNFGKNTVVPRLKQDTASWDNQPNFSTVVNITSKRWTLQAKVDKRNQSGKIYNWVDKGTASRSVNGGNPYTIVAKHKTANGMPGMLKFTVPHHPISLPNPAVSGFPPSGESKTVITPVVTHPGIYPRNFTKTILEELKGKQAGGFKSVIDAAIKRAIRKS